MTDDRAHKNVTIINRGTKGMKPQQLLYTRMV
jgi:hypothetical protein